MLANAPSKSRARNSLGMAVTSLLLPSTATRPSVRRAPVAQALTRWMALRAPSREPLIHVPADAVASSGPIREEKAPTDATASAGTCMRHALGEGRGVHRRAWPG